MIKKGWCIMFVIIIMVILGFLGIFIEIFMNVIFLFLMKEFGVNFVVI